MTLKRLLIFTISITLSVIVFSQNYQNIQFVENRGQWDSRVKFKGEVSNGMFMIRNDGVTIVQSNDADLANLAEVIHNRPGGEQENVRIRSHVWDVDFLNASPQARLIPEKPLNTYNNYFIGNDPSRWAGECHIFQAITMEEIYPNINARYYTDNGVLKYDIIVKPGGDVSKIALKYNGVNNLQVKKKELVLSTSLGDFKESKPLTYQRGVSARKEVDCKYIVQGNIVRFQVDDYDPNEVLVIDPSIIFCSFSGSSADTWGFTATYGPDGSMYAGGIVWGAGFPTNPGVYDNTFNGGDYDMAIIKLTPDGTNRVYATYIGGNEKDQPHSLIVDNQGNLIIAGRSNSGSSYPTANPIGAGSEIGDLGSFDIVVTKLNAAGSGLIGSKRIGGVGNDGVNISPIRENGANSIMRNYGDDGRSEVILDNAGNIYVASCTQSNVFPITPGAFQTTPGGNQDGVLLKLTPDLGALIFASYLGGIGNDAAYVLSIAPNGDIFVGGGTESSNLFPAGASAGTIGPTHHNPSGVNPIDGFVAIVSSDGSTLKKGTYIGTSGIDQVFGLKFDNSGFPYIMGQTTGS
ncbi:MAG TPA: SBBP repeat-containing protein, partial [Chitinophagaceae bacterium]|nr:SBBP repeat-containing protein [Chitinophagaceae bacterium]